MAETAYSVFADESGTGDGAKCYTLGALAIPTERLARFKSYFDQAIAEHGVVGEAKWHKIGKSHGPINFGLCLFRDLLRVGCRMGFIVVKKSEFIRWNEDREEGFYLSYTYLIRDILRMSTLPHSVFIDQRDDSYSKQDEAMQKIVTNMLSQIKAKSSIASLDKADSRMLAGIQAIDLFTGAINASHNTLLDPAYVMNRGKRLMIERLASVIGWDDLCYDTYPFPSATRRDIRTNPNIWHFPETYRRQPSTQTISFDRRRDVKFVTADDLRIR